MYADFLVNLNENTAVDTLMENAMCDDTSCDCDCIGGGCYCITD